MTPMERMLCALNHTEADRVPVYPILAGVARNLIGASYPDWSQNADLCAESLLKAADEFELDCLVTLIDLSVECDAWGQKIIYPENEAAHPDYDHKLIEPIEDYKKIRAVDWRGSKRMNMMVDVVKKIADRKKGQLPIVAFVFGPLGTLSMMRGQQDMYMDLYDDPDAVREAVDEVTKTLKGYVEALCDAGADAVMFDTLFASGSIMSKDMWRDMEAEGARTLADAVRAKGKLVMVHNCGNLCYFDAQIESMNPVAISFLHPADDCADFVETKKKYGDKVTLIGCVTPANAIVGTDEEWDAECLASLRDMGKGGGFVLATGCEYPSGASLDRARRMVNIAKTAGSYKD